jgi:transposase
MKGARIGIGLATQAFQAHGIDCRGKVGVWKRLTRGHVLPVFAQLSPCLIELEAWATAHYWARELMQLGHDVRLMAPQFVRPYRKPPKNDGNDAEAISEAVSRPTMRCVPVKSVAQQAVLTVHRARELLVRERTTLVHQRRGLLAGYGIISGQGIERFRQALPRVLADADNGLPVLAREVIAELQERLHDLDQRITGSDCRLTALARHSKATQRLMQLEGVGAVTATAIVATIGAGKAFKNGRQFPACLGLVPRQYSSGGKPCLGHISKQGDVYLRTLLRHGSRSVLRLTGQATDAKGRWAERLKQRRGNTVAAVALAAKPARIIWALLARNQAHHRAA